MFDRTTRIEATREPMKGLTSVAKDEFLKALTKLPIGDTLYVPSVRLATNFPIDLEREGFQLITESLSTNPKGEYLVNLVFKTTDEREYVRPFHPLHEIF